MGKFTEWLRENQDKDTQLDQTTKTEPNIVAQNAARQLGVELTPFLQALKKVLKGPVNPNTMISREDVQRVAQLLNVPGNYQAPTKGIKNWID